MFEEDESIFMIQTKRPLFGLAVFLMLAQCSFANTDCCFCLKGGFFAGIGPGCVWYRMEETVHVSALNSPLLYTHSSISPISVIGNLHIGYGHYFSRAYYLGLEMDGNLSAADTSSNTTFETTIGQYSVDAKVKIPGCIGAAVLTGYRPCDPVLLYVRLGYSGAFVRQRESAALNGNAFLNSIAEKFANGIHAGIGFSVAAPKRLSLRFDYRYAYYWTYNNTYQSLLSITEVNVSPSSNQICLTLDFAI